MKLFSKTCLEFLKRKIEISFNTKAFDKRYSTLELVPDLDSIYCNFLFNNSNWNNKENAHAEISLVHRGLKMLFTFKMEIVFKFAKKKSI